MYKDLYRKEDAIPALLLLEVMRVHIRRNPDIKETYDNDMINLNQYIEACFKGLPTHKQAQLSRSAKRVITNISDYFHHNKFSVRKGNLVAFDWAIWLHRSEFIKIDRRSKLALYLFKLRKIIKFLGYGETEGFDKAHQSAINHVPKIHTIATDKGYYL